MLQTTHHQLDILANLNEIWQQEFENDVGIIFDFRETL